MTPAEPLVGDTEPLRIGVVIADDHPVVVEGLSALVAGMPEMQLLGVAATGNEAVAVCRAHAPNLVVMDIEMPEVDGLDAIRTITAEFPAVRILVFSTHDNDEVLFAAVRAGAHGYVVKGTKTSEVAQALRGVASGNAVFGPAVASRVLEFFSQARPPTRDALAALTAREREVLGLMAAGHGTREIARRLVVTPKTTRNYISAVVHKLHVEDRANAIALAREQGLGEVS
jgi:DNA-binding NarL/FixJ family response regulator